MNDCEKYQEEASALIDGELCPERAVGIRAHLESCAACRAVVDEWKSAAEAALAVREPAATRWETMWSHMELGTVRRQGALRLRRDIRRAVFTAATAAMVLVGVYIFMPGQPVMGPLVSRQGDFEVVAIETSPDFTFVVMAGENEDVPVIWLERI